jgi:hypothetical protein
MTSSCCPAGLSTYNLHHCVSAAVSWAIETCCLTEPGCNPATSLPSVPEPHLQPRLVGPRMHFVTPNKVCWPSLDCWVWTFGLINLRAGALWPLTGSQRRPWRRELSWIGLKHSSVSSLISTEVTNMTGASYKYNYFVLLLKCSEASI